MIDHAAEVADIDPAAALSAAPMVVSGLGRRPAQAFVEVSARRYGLLREHPWPASLAARAGSSPRSNRRAAAHGGPSLAVVSDFLLCALRFLCRSRLALHLSLRVLG